MSAVDTKFYEKKKSSTFLTACIFLVFVVLITGGMFFYNSQIQKSIGVLESKKAQLESSISTVQENPGVQIYKIYQSNKPIFERYAKESEIPLFVSHLKKQFLKYDISATGFNYGDGIVRTSLSASSNETGEAYEKIVRMVEQYGEDEKALFEIGTIGSYSGYDRINFPGEFILK